MFLNYGLSIICFLVIGSTGLEAQSFPPPKPLTDEEQIRIILHNIEQGIKQQNRLKIVDSFSQNFNHGDSTSSRHILWRRLRMVFENSQERWQDSLFQTITPMESGQTGTWDFELEIDTLRILNDHIAQVKAWIYFGASPPDSTSNWPFGKKHRENIMFRKIDGEWRVKKVEKLIRILSDFGENGG